MKKITDSITLLAVTAWVGATWAMGYLAAPVLFQVLPDRQLAGMLAGKLFSITATMGIVCALYLLGYYVFRCGKQVFRHKTVWVISLMLLLTLLGQLVFQPLLAELKTQALPAAVMHSEFAGQFRAWHGVASITYLIQSLLGLVLVLRVADNRTDVPQRNAA